jgi:4-aminobutyrate aminotransferase/(S)-3-amino-2-methylpropionate transaminase
MREQDLAERSRAIGALMHERLTSITEKHACVGDVRGRGAMMAVEIVDPDSSDGRSPHPVRTAAVSAYCHSHGVVTLTCGTYGNVLRFLPPLVISDALLTDAFDVLSAAFDATA